MRTGDTAGLTGIIGEISLGILMGFIADNLDGRLIGADSTIGSKTPEEAGSIVMRNDIGIIDRDRKMSDIIFDSDRESGPGLLGIKEVIDSLDMLRSSILGRDAITSADDEDIVTSTLLKGSDNIKVKRLAGSARFLRTIKDSNLLNGLR